MKCFVQLFDINTKKLLKSKNYCDIINIGKCRTKNFVELIDISFFGGHTK